MRERAGRWVGLRATWRGLATAARIDSDTAATPEAVARFSAVVWASSGLGWLAPTWSCNLLAVDSSCARAVRADTDGVATARARRSCRASRPVLSRTEVRRI